MAATRRAAALLSLAVLSATGVRADDRASAGVWVHTDDDQLTVVHPVASARAEVAEDTHVGVGYDADVISAATVDVRTSASPRGFEETRHGLSAGVDHALSRTVSVGTGYALSLSPDHVTHAGSLRGAVEDDDRVNIYAASLGVARDSVGRAGDEEPVGSLWSLGGSLSWTTLLSADAVLDLAAAVEHQRGYLESPYRFVPVTTAMGQREVRVPEEVPDVRWRGALRGQIRLALTHWLFGRAFYRLHADDWGIAGHTLQLRVDVEPADRWLVAVHGRFHGQRGASFYDGEYDTLPEIPSLRTLDRELAPGFYVAGGLRVEHALGHWLGLDWRVDARAEVLRRRYIDTPQLPQRLSLTAGVGLVVER